MSTFADMKTMKTWLAKIKYQQGAWHEDKQLSESYILCQCLRWKCTIFHEWYELTHLQQKVLKHSKNVFKQVLKLSGTRTSDDITQTSEVMHFLIVSS